MLVLHKVKYCNLNKNKLKLTSLVGFKQSVFNLSCSNAIDLVGNGMTKIWTHAELCKKAVIWLRRTQKAGGGGCTNAFSEVRSNPHDGEIPDAIGIKTSRNTETIVVEVKTNRSDFIADQRKTFRQNPENGMGNYRYYLCPEGLIRASELPPKWGLIYIGYRGKATVICGHCLGDKKDWHFQSNRDAELGVASILLAKAGDFEILNGVNRLNQRLTKENTQLKRKVQDLESSNRHEELMNSLNDLGKTLKPIPRQSNMEREDK